jgi:hypothetical protein
VVDGINEVTNEKLDFSSRNVGQKLHNMYGLAECEFIVCGLTLYSITAPSTQFFLHQK